MSKGIDVVLLLKLADGTKIELNMAEAKDLYHRIREFVANFEKPSETPQE